MAVNRSRKLFEEAKKYIPGGVNSPVRSLKSVGLSPIFIRKAKGSKIYDEEGKEFIDYCMSWGALILGHAYPETIRAVKAAAERGTSYGTATRAEIELARMISEAVPSMEQVRLVNSGTEAVMSAVRLARACTGRNKILKFEGSYHGHADYLLVKAGSGLAGHGLAASAGVPADFIRQTLVAPYNDLKKTEEIIKRNRKDLAAVIVEPVLANCGVIPPKPGFLEGLRAITEREDILLIFDEVITGFRLSYGGAQEYFGIRPDLTCLGKIVGGGFPLAAFGGRKKIMELLSPLGEVYQAGTLSGNPVAVSAGISVLRILKKTSPYEKMRARTSILAGIISDTGRRCGVQLKISAAASLFSIFFTAEEVTDFGKAQTQNLKLFGKFYRNMIEENIYLSPSGFESNFLSLAHTGKDIEKTAEAVEKSLKKMRG